MDTCSEKDNRQLSNSQTLTRVTLVLDFGQSSSRSRVALEFDHRPCNRYLDFDQSQRSIIYGESWKISRPNLDLVIESGSKLVKVQAVSSQSLGLDQLQSSSSKTLVKVQSNSRSSSDLVKLQKGDIGMECPIIFAVYIVNVTGNFNCHVVQRSWDMDMYLWQKRGLMR